MEKIEQILQEIGRKTNKHEDNLPFKATRTISWKVEDVALGCR